MFSLFGSKGGKLETASCIDITFDVVVRHWLETIQQAKKRRLNAITTTIHLPFDHPAVLPDVFYAKLLIRDPLQGGNWRACLLFQNT